MAERSIISLIENRDSTGACLPTARVWYSQGRAGGAMARMLVESSWRVLTSVVVIQTVYMQTKVNIHTEVLS